MATQGNPWGMVVSQIAGDMSKVASGVGSLLTGIADARSAREQAAIEQQRAEFQVQMNDIYNERAQDTFRLERENIAMHGGEMVGEQKVAYASQGVKVGSGVQKGIEAKTLSRVSDAIADNKRRAMEYSFGVRVSNYDTLNDARLSKIAGQKKAREAILGGVAGMTSQISSIGSPGETKDGTSLGAFGAIGKSFMGKGLG